MKGYSHIDISTIAISLAKVMKQAESHGQRAATGSLHRILHNLLVGINSENKHYIFSEIAVHATPILSKFDARSLSNLIFRFALQNTYPRMKKDVKSWMFLLSRQCRSCTISILKSYPTCYGRMQKWSHQTWCYSRQQAT
jgi:hypothetical protein